MKAMWLVAIGAAVLASGTQESRAAVEGPWCFHQSMGRAGVFSKCDMPSYEACRREMFGVGQSYCTQNPYYWWNANNQPQQRVVKRRVRHY